MIDQGRTAALTQAATGLVVAFGRGDYDHVREVLNDTWARHGGPAAWWDLAAAFTGLIANAAGVPIGGPGFAGFSLADPDTDELVNADDEGAEAYAWACRIVTAHINADHDFAVKVFNSAPDVNALVAGMTVLLRLTVQVTGGLDDTSDAGSASRLGASTGQWRCPECGYCATAIGTDGPPTPGVLEAAISAHNPCQFRPSATTRA